MSAAHAVGLYSLAERALRIFGACPEVAELYLAASVALAAADQSYLASEAAKRCNLVSSLL